VPERRRQVPVAMNRNPAILLLVALPVTGCGKQGIEYTHHVPPHFRREQSCGAEWPQNQDPPG